jgi:hypothetical protein
MSLTLGSMLAASGARAAPVIPMRSRRAMGAAPIWVPIGFRGFGIPGSGGIYDSTNNSVNDLFYFQAPSFASVIAVRLVYTGFDLSNFGPVDRGVSVSGYASVLVPGNVFSGYLASAASSGATSLSMSLAAGLGGNMASVGMAVSGTTGLPSGVYVSSVSPVYAAATGNLSTYTVGLSTATATSTAPGSGALTSAIASGAGVSFGNLIFPAKLGGSRQITIPPMHDVVITDPLPVEIATGGGAFVKASWTFGGTGLLLASLPSPASGSTRAICGGFTESSYRGLSMSDLSLAPVQPSNSGGGWWPPAMILAQLNTRAVLPSVMVIGDSIGAGTGDATDANYRMGFIARSLGNTVPWFSTARGSTSATQYQNAWRGLFRMATEANCTSLILQLGRNDINASVAATGTYSLKTTLAALAAPFLGSGIAVYVVTIPPTTSSTDGWTTLGNQSIPVAANETQRLAYNADIRANWASYGYGGLIDIANVVEYGGRANPGSKWRVDLGAASADGVHPSPALHNALISAGVVTPAMFGVT